MKSFKSVIVLCLLSLTLLLSSCTSVNKTVLPTKDSTPKQVLEILVDCIKKGDSKTFCKLFADSDEEKLKSKFKPVFLGPQHLENVSIEEYDSEESQPKSKDTVTMIVTFDVIDAYSDWGLTEKGDLIAVTKFSDLKKIDGVWKVITFESSSP